MHDDPLIAALTGRAVTADQLEGARRHLLMLRSLLDEVRSTWSAVLPDPPRTWRSGAAEAYAAQPEDLRVSLAGAAGALAEAEAALEVRVQRLEELAAVQATGTSAGSR
jgi:hypothetical protein